MGTRPHVYGDDRRFKATLSRHVSSGRDLLDRLGGVRKMMASASGGPRNLVAQIYEQEWTEEVERWRRNVFRSVHRHLADGAPSALPVTTAAWPPNTGKPWHARTIEWVEPWLRESLEELLGLRDALGVRRGVAAESPPSAQFGELEASGLVDSSVIDGHATDMRNLRTPKQLADAIGAAKELTEATLRGALDRLGEPWNRGDNLPGLMKKWRRRVDGVAPPDDIGREMLSRAQGELGNLVTFLAAWRNAYGRGHGRPNYPPGLKPRHARLAVDAAETAVRFIVTTMDDLELLPP
jgi:hypothetical protein